MKDLFRLIKLFKPYYHWLALGIFLSLITLLANVALLALSGWFITAMAIAGVTGVAINYFTPAALIRAAAIIRTAGRYAERLVTHEATFRLLSELRVWFYQHLEPLAPAGLESYKSGDLLSRIRADIDTLNNVYLRLIVPVVVALISSVLFFIFLSFYNPLLALVELTLLLIAGVIVPLWVNRLAYDTGKQITQTQSQLRSAIINDLQGMGELLIYGADTAHAEHIEHLSQQLATQQQKMSRISGLSQAPLGLCASLALWASLLMIIPMVNNGSQLPAKLAMLALFSLASFEAVMPLPFAFQSLGETFAAARRIFNIIDKKNLITEPTTPATIHTPLHIKFEQVSFRYPANHEWILESFNLDIPPQTSLAIMGQTGSGKSSLINILLRFYPINAGKILINNTSIEHYNSETLRQHIAVVPQQNHLFNDSILKNLRLAKHNATMQEIETACKAAQIHDFIQAQPEGYHTLVGEIGTRLSGGQRQRIAIARALLKPASVLILDEPTEGLDPQTADKVIKNLYQWAKDKQQTLIIITHRLEGIENSDQIINLSRRK